RNFYSLTYGKGEGRRRKFSVKTSPFFGDGGGRRTRTFEVIRRLIYSLFRAASRPLPQVLEPAVFRLPIIQEAPVLQWFSIASLRQCRITSCNILRTIYRRRHEHGANMAAKKQRLTDADVKRLP